MFGNPTGRHLPHAQAKPVEVCPECQGRKYIGEILGICPCPRGCATAEVEDKVWTEQERLERLSARLAANERGRLK